MGDPDTRSGETTAALQIHIRAMIKSLQQTLLIRLCNEVHGCCFPHRRHQRPGVQ